MKKIIAAILLIPTTIAIGGLIKYNLDLNKFINGENIEISKNRIKSEATGTEVHIVGTVHFETAKIKRNNFYNFIDSISPSVILYEGNSSVVKRIVNKTDYFAQLIETFRNQERVEKPVVLKYLKHHPDAVLLPYEWEIRDKYHRKHNLDKQSKKMINAVIGLDRKKLLTNDQSDIIDQFFELNNPLVKIAQSGTFADINKLDTDSILRQRQLYMYSKIPEIAKDRKELSEYLDFLPIHMNYWDIRNKAMAQNILKQIKLNPNKVIVVLTGFYHRYYLIDELKKYETEYEFSIEGL